MEEHPVASTSSAPILRVFRGFSPPKWLFSDDSATTPSQLSTAAGLGARLYHGNGEDDASYGPQLKRRGNIRFVPAARPEASIAQEDSGAKGKGKETEADLEPAPSRGLLAKNFYQEVLKDLKLPLASTSRVSAGTASLPLPLKPVDLTLDSDSDDEDCVYVDSTGVPLPTLSPPSDDECIVLDPITHASLPVSIVPRPSPPPKPRRPRALHELIALPSSAPLALPIQYAIKQNNIGWRLLQKAGWREGQGLGPPSAEGVEDRSLKVPLKASDKFDRKGLGGDSDTRGKRPLTTREKEELRMVEEHEQKRKRGKGESGMAKRRKREQNERRAMLAYMNR